MAYRSGFFDNRRGTRLFYAEELPDGAPAGAAWIICSPILEEKNVAHGAWVTFGRALSAAGVRSLRIDYEGHGDSDGDTAALGLDEWVDDVCDAAARLRADGVTRLTLFGCRAGALIAARAAAVLGAERLVVWCPVLTGADHVQDLLRLNLTTQLSVYKKVQHDRDAMIASLAAGETINIVGWTMGRRLLESLNAASFQQAIDTLSCPVEIFDLTRRPGAVPPAIEPLLSARVRGQGVTGLQFWIDGNYLDSQQTALVNATMGLTASA
jgi:exosortase A-associated hydrolase 2